MKINQYICRNADIESISDSVYIGLWLVILLPLFTYRTNGRETDRERTISKNSFGTPYFDTQHFISEKKYFTGVPKIKKKLNDIQKIVSGFV